MEEGIEEKMRGGGRRRERWDTTGFGGKRGGGRRREKWGVMVSGEHAGCDEIARDQIIKGT